MYNLTIETWEEDEKMFRDIATIKNIAYADLRLLIGRLCDLDSPIACRAEPAKCPKDK